MTKITLITAITFLIFNNFYAQNELKKKNYGLFVSYKQGTSTLENNNIGRLNGNISVIEGKFILTAFNNTKLGLGVGYLEYGTNYFDGTFNSNLNNSYIHLPLSISHRLSMHKDDANGNLFFVFGIGIYANNLISSKTSNLSAKSTLNNQGWNYGNTAEFGFEYVFKDNVHFGLYVENMNDMTSTKKNNLEQKLINSNLIKFGAGVNF